MSTLLLNRIKHNWQHCFDFCKFSLPSIHLLTAALCKTASPAALKHLLRSCWCTVNNHVLKHKMNFLQCVGTI